MLFDKKKLFDTIPIVCLIIFFAVGIVLHLNPKWQVFAVSITEYFLLFINVCLILVTIIQTKQRRLMFYGLVIFFITIAIEIAGVYTGKVFGTYVYSGLWKLIVGNVPVVIGINWLVFILASVSMAKTVFQKLPNLAVIIISGTILVLADVLIEQVALKLGYWHWKNNVIPMQNYLAWFAIGVVSASLQSFMKVQLKTSLLNAYYMVNLVFFTLVILFG